MKIYAVRGVPIRIDESNIKDFFSEEQLKEYYAETDESEREWLLAGLTDDLCKEEWYFSPELNDCHPKKCGHASHSHAFIGVGHCMGELNGLLTTPVGHMEIPKELMERFPQLKDAKYYLVECNR